MKNPDEDYAYETYRQKRLDDALIIGRALTNAEKMPKFEHADKWKDIPFEEDRPPRDGLLVLWGVYTTLVLLLSAYLIWGSK